MAARADGDAGAGRGGEAHGVDHVGGGAGPDDGEGEARDVAAVVEDAAPDGGLEGGGVGGVAVEDGGGGRHCGGGLAGAGLGVEVEVSDAGLEGGHDWVRDDCVRSCKSMSRSSVSR